MTVEKSTLDGIEAIVFYFNNVKRQKKRSSNNSSIEIDNDNDNNLPSSLNQKHQSEEALYLTFEILSKKITEFYYAFHLSKANIQTEQ